MNRLYDAHAAMLDRQAAGEAAAEAASALPLDDQVALVAGDYSKRHLRPKGYDLLSSQIIVTRIVDAGLVSELSDASLRTLNGFTHPSDPRHSAVRAEQSRRKHG